MGRLVGVAALLAVASGCTSVKMLQRDGCWVRRTEKSFGRVVEEVGPCGRPQPRWSDDRLTRLVQECVAQADWRWQSKALEVWSRRLPYPTPQPTREEVLRTCMEEVRSGMAAEIDAGTLQKRLADASGRVTELSSERDALRRDVEQDRSKLHETQAKLADWLGQAAQKPPGNATASATSSSTSDGKATNESGATLAAESGASAPPAAPPVSSASVVIPGLPASTQPAAPTASPPSSPTAAPVATQAPRKARARRPAPVVQARAAPACAPAPPGAAPCEAAPGATGTAAKP